MKELNLTQMEEINGGLQVMCATGVAWTGMKIGGFFGGIMGMATGAIIGSIVGLVICD